jgi:uncharacterized protein YjiS (DUF1127 family)
MSYIPMHNRFVEGFIEPEPSGETLDPLSSQILPTRPASPDSDELLRHARMARAAALGAGLVRAGRFLATVFSGPAWSLIDRFVGWRRRERAAGELYAIDARTLAEIGVHRADIPFILAQGGWERRKP